MLRILLYGAYHADLSSKLRGKGSFGQILVAVIACKAGSSAERLPLAVIYHDLLMTILS